MLSDKHLEDYRFYLSKDGLPEGWEVVSLSDVSTKITDGTHKTPKYQPSGVRFISIKNIKPYRPVDWLSYEKYITPEEHAELTKRCKPEFNDILFPRIGTLGYAKRVDFEEEVSIFVGLGLIKPIHDAVLPKYLEYYMNTGYIDRLSREKANGSGRLTLPLAQTKRFPIPIPPIQEQDRIIEKIDTLFARLDKGEEAVRKVQKLLTRYRQSVLKSAVSGQLTADWRAQRDGQSDNANDLLLSILETRRAEWAGRGKYKEPKAPNLTDLPDLPDSWTWTNMDALIVKGPQNGLYLPQSKYGEGTPIIRIDDYQTGWARPMDELRKVTGEPSEVELYALSENDFVVNRVNSVSHLGKTMLVGIEHVGALFESNMMRLAAAPEIDPAYLELYLSSAIGRKRLIANCKHAVNQASINQGDVRATSVPLPPADEQREIVALARDRLAKTEVLVDWCETELKRSASLRQSILKDAFAGRLVPQDPKDEPACDLLKQISRNKKGS